MIPVGRLAPGNQWDQHLLLRLLDGTLYPHGLDVRHYPNYPNTDGCALVVPGRYWAGHEAEINEAVAAYHWLLFIRTSDEEDLFDVGKINHPNARFWVQTPRTDRKYGDARLFGCGFPAHFDRLPAEPPGKDTGVFLSAQDNHGRRQECFETLMRAAASGSGVVERTAGFTQGMPKDEYRAIMTEAKIAPAPAGKHTPDTFRLYEALEAHCVPIADDIASESDSEGYWRMLFPDAPFPILTHYGSLPGYIGEALGGWPANANRIAAWWMRQKRAMAHWLLEDLEQLGAL